MHRAGVDRARRRRGLGRFRGEVALGIRAEFRGAAGRAEIEALPLMLVAVLGGACVDRHAADGVDDAMLPIANRRVGDGSRGAAPMIVQMLAVRMVPLMMMMVVVTMRPMGMCAT